MASNKEREGFFHKFTRQKEEQQIEEAKEINQNDQVWLRRKDAEQLREKYRLPGDSTTTYTVVDLVDPFNVARGFMIQSNSHPHQPPQAVPANAVEHVKH